MPSSRADALAQPARELDAVGHRHAGDRHERHDVDRADARVRAAGGVVMSIRSSAATINWKAPSSTASGSPTKVITVRFVSAPGSTSSSVTPGTAPAAFGDRLVDLGAPPLGDVRHTFDDAHETPISFASES